MMPALMSAIEGTSGLVLLTMSFVDHDPERTCRANPDSMLTDNCQSA